MKALLINGSPRPNGCTFTALTELANTLEAEGIETEIVHSRRLQTVFSPANTIRLPSLKQARTIAASCRSSSQTALTRTAPCWNCYTVLPPRKMQHLPRSHWRGFKNGQEVYMSRYEYGVLSLMARHPGQLFTKEQIFEAVWHQDSESCLTAVTNAIGRIRQKIEDDRAAPVYIRTISNLGYQFMPTVSAESVEKDS